MTRGPVRPERTRPRVKRASAGLKALAGRARARFGRGVAWLRSKPAAAAAVAGGLLGFVSLIAGLAVGSWTAVCRDCPSTARIYVWEPRSATKLLDREGRLIDELFQNERRTPVEIETLPEYVKYAFIAIEDKRFYRHPGFDLRRIVTANLRNVASGRITGGGSTITQQLARWMFTEEIGFEQILTRKLKELKVARELERVYEKDQILEAYINQVNYGDGRHGIEAATQYFFGKPAVELTVAEAALLAAVVNRPTTFSPFRNPERSRGRRNIVLRYMANQGYITQEECERWMEEPLPEVAHRNDDGTIAPYFAEWVRTILVSRYGSDDLYSRGFRVTTTLDLDMQRAAQIAMDSGWARIENTPGFRGVKYADAMADTTRRRTSQTEYLQGLFIALDPQSGEIRALIGGRDFRDSEFNRAIRALRQPGSTFKPFTFTAAIQSGIPASRVIDDSPIMVPMHDSTIYSPRNYDDDFKGPLTLRDAMRMSINTVTVKLGMEIGLETVAQTAKQLGLSTEVQPYPSTPIGSFAVYPIELVAAYTAFANTGTHVTPRPILKVEDADGRLLWETFPEREEVLDSAVAAIVRDMLSTAINNGSGAPARTPDRLPYEVPAAGKTGTTNDATDIWFVGFTPDLLAGVWFGYDLPRTILPRAAGGVYAAPVWGHFMRQLYYGENPQFEVPAPWPWPSGITTRLVDRETGRLASSFCPEDRAYAEHFIAGTEPTDLCRPADGLFGGRVRRSRMDTTTIDTLPSTIRSPFRRRMR